MQAHKASKALLKHINAASRPTEKCSGTKNLLEEGQLIQQPIELVLTTKKHIVPQKRLKPAKILLPHAIQSLPTLSICLITPDPQRKFKDAITDPTFPKALAERITRVIDVKKLEKKYHSFESKRLLLDSHDIFLADDRIVTYLSKILGKTFYDSTSKRPIPLRLQPSKSKEEKLNRKNTALPSAKPPKQTPDLRSIIPPAQMAHEIERTLSSTIVPLSSSITTVVRIGLSTFTPDQLTANVEAVVGTMIDRFVPSKWKGIRSIHIKGPSTMALPIYLAEELWEDETQVLEEAEIERAKLDASTQKEKKRKTKKKKRALLEVDAVEQVIDGTGVAKVDSQRKEAGSSESKKKRKREADTEVDAGMNAEMKERREKLRRQKREIGEKMESKP